MRLLAMMFAQGDYARGGERHNPTLTMHSAQYVGVPRMTAILDFAKVLLR